MNQRLYTICIIPLLACTTKAADTAEETTMVDPYSQELWEEIEGFQDWGQYAGWEGVVQSDAVHGDYVSIWINEAALSALTTGETIPDGGILVKESFIDSEGETLKDITVMKKVDGYNPEGGNWYWGQYLGDGTVEEAGSPAMCTGCHSSGADYVRVIGE